MAQCLHAANTRSTRGMCPATQHEQTLAKATQQHDTSETLHLARSGVSLASADEARVSGGKAGGACLLLPRNSFLLSQDARECDPITGAQAREVR